MTDATSKAGKAARAAGETAPAPAAAQADDDGELAAQVAALKAELEAMKAAKATAEQELEEARKAAGDKAVSEEAAAAQALRDQRKVILTIHSTGRNDSWPVPVGCGGREYLIVRDKPVLVPKDVAGVLDLAVRKEPHTVKDRDTGQERTEFREAKRYSYTVKDYEAASAAERAVAEANSGVVGA